MVPGGSLPESPPKAAAVPAQLRCRRVPRPSSRATRSVAGW